MILSNRDSRKTLLLYFDVDCNHLEKYIDTNKLSSIEYITLDISKKIILFFNSYLHELSFQIKVSLCLINFSKYYIK